jgi:hypothetical protein
MTFDPDRGLGRFRCRYDHQSRGTIEISVARGTWFENVKTSPSKIVLLVYAFATDSSYETAIRESSIDEKVTFRATVVDWYLYNRECGFIALGRQYEEEGLIGGEGHVVEIDETKIGKRKYNTGRLKEGTSVLGMIHRDGSFRL